MKCDKKYFLGVWTCNWKPFPASQLGCSKLWNAVLNTCLICSNLVKTLSYFQGGSSSSCLEAGANVVGGGWRRDGQAGWWHGKPRKAVERQLAAGSRGIDPGLTRLNSLPQWWQGVDGQWSSYPCVSTLSPSHFNCSILNFSSAFPVMLPIKPQSWTESGPKLIVWSGEQWIRKTAEL